MSSILRMRARRERLLLAASTISVMGLALSLSSQDRSYWTGDWRATSIADSFPLIAILPLTSAYAALISSREPRTGFSQVTRTMPRTSSSVRMMDWVIGAAAGCFAYLTVAIVTGFLTWIDSGSVAPWLSYHACAISSVAASAAIGVWMGQVAPPRWSAVGAAVSTLALIFTFSTLPDPVDRLLLFQTDIFSSPHLALNSVIVLLIVAVSIALVYLAVTWQTSIIHRSLSLLCAAATIFTLAYLPVDTEVPRSPELGECYGSEPEVCIWPEHRKWGPRTADVAKNLAATFPAATNAKYAETGLFAPHATSFFLAAPHVSDAAIADSLLSPLLPTTSSVFRKCSREVLADFIRFKAWLMIRATGGTFGVAGVEGEVKEIIRKPEAVQDGWATRTFNTVEKCSGSGSRAGK